MLLLLLLLFSHFLTVPRIVLSFLSLSLSLSLSLLLVCFIVPRFCSLNNEVRFGNMNMVPRANKVSINSIQLSAFPCGTRFAGV